jgi:hypothetical protein
MRVWMWLVVGLLVIGALLGGSRPVIADDAPPPQQQGNGSLTGIVTDDKDKPVVGMPLRLYVTEHANVERIPGKKMLDPISPSEHEVTPLAEKLVTTVKTDSKGKFTFSDVKAGAYLLRGSRKGVGFIYQEVEIKAGQSSDLGTIKLSKP